MHIIYVGSLAILNYPTFEGLLLKHIRFTASMMHKFKFLLFLTIAFLGSHSTVQGQEWIKMYHDSLQFSIKSPEALIEKENEAMTEVGNLTINSFGLLPKEGHNLLYQVMVMNYPYGALPLDSVELRTVMLYELVEQSASANEAEVVYKQEVEYFGLQGMQWRVHSGADISIKSRAFIYNDRIYIVQVMSKRTQSLNKDIDRFLDSFKIYTEF